MQEGAALQAWCSHCVTPSTHTRTERTWYFSVCARRASAPARPVRAPRAPCRFSAPQTRGRMLNVHACGYAGRAQDPRRARRLCVRIVPSAHGAVHQQLRRRYRSAGGDDVGGVVDVQECAVLHRRCPYARAHVQTRTLTHARACARAHMRSAAKGRWHWDDLYCLTCGGTIVGLSPARSAPPLPVPSPALLMRACQPCAEAPDVRARARESAHTQTHARQYTRTHASTHTHTHTHTHSLAFAPQGVRRGKRKQTRRSRRRRRRRGEGAGRERECGVWDVGRLGRSSQSYLYYMRY